jgi:hypothetical protein
VRWMNGWLLALLALVGKTGELDGVDHRRRGRIEGGEAPAAQALTTGPSESLKKWVKYLGQVPTLGTY